MSLFAWAMMQPVTVRRRTGLDARGTPIYAAPEQILGRLHLAYSEVVDQSGMRHPCEATLYTPSSMSVGDMVTISPGVERPVQAVTQHQDVCGQYDHSEVRL